MFLVLLSGGADSVWTLWKVLSTTTQEVYAIHVNFLDTRNWKQEQRASRMCVDWLRQNIRSFSYKEVDIRLGGQGSFLNVMFLAPIVADLCFKYMIEKVFFGECKEEMIRTTPGGFTLFRPLLLECLTNADNRWMLHTMPEIIQSLPTIPSLERPGVDKPKLSILEEMPFELARLTWSCFNPKFKHKPCKQCKKCETRYDFDTFHGL